MYPWNPGNRRIFRVGANSGRFYPSELLMNSAAVSIPQTLREKVNVSLRTKDEPENGWISRLIEREGPGILRMLWRILGREQDVMDAYQDCFCKLAAVKRAGDIKNAKAYAYRTASNIAIELIRVRGRRTAHLPAIAAEQERTEGAESGESGSDTEWDAHGERLRRALARLPDHLRNVVVLRDLSRLPYNEVGRTLGIESSTARVYRRHAVVRLAELLNEGDAS